MRNPLGGSCPRSRVWRTVRPIIEADRKKPKALSYRPRSTMNDGNSPGARSPGEPGAARAVLPLAGPEGLRAGAKRRFNTASWPTRGSRVDVTLQPIGDCDGPTMTWSPGGGRGGATPVRRRRERPRDRRPRARIRAAHVALLARRRLLRAPVRAHPAGRVRARRRPPPAHRVLPRRRGDAHGVAHHRGGRGGRRRRGPGSVASAACCCSSRAAWATASTCSHSTRSAGSRCSPW